MHLVTTFNILTANISNIIIKIESALIYPIFYFNYTSSALYNTINDNNNDNIEEIPYLFNFYKYKGEKEVIE